jgi:hypothetical protein
MSHCLENWLWKRLWTCRKTDERMNESEGFRSLRDIAVGGR